MLQNMPVKTLVHKDLTIEGYSRAGANLLGVPELKVGFDLGRAAVVVHGHRKPGSSSTRTSTTSPRLPVYVARRRMMKMEPPTIYLPEVAVEPVRRSCSSSRGSTGAACRASCRPIETGQRDRTLARARRHAFRPRKHTVPSMGFVVWERRRKLKTEYIGLSGPQIRDLRLGGTDVTEEQSDRPVRLPAATARRGLGQLPGDVRGPGAGHGDDVRRRRRTARTRSTSSGTCTWTTSSPARERFQNELIIASHFSTRYTSKRIRDVVAKVVPDMFDGRLQLWL